MYRCNFHKTNCFYFAEKTIILIQKKKRFCLAILSLFSYDSQRFLFQHFIRDVADLSSAMICFLFRKYSSPLGRVWRRDNAYFDNFYSSFRYSKKDCCYQIIWISLAENNTWNGWIRVHVIRLSFSKLSERFIFRESPDCIHLSTQII